MKSKIDEIKNKYPWTEEDDQQLKGAKVSQLFKEEEEDPEDSNLEEQADMAREEIIALESDFKNNPARFIEDMIDRTIQFVNAFSDRGATQEDKLKVWPDYEKYTEDYIKVRVLQQRKFLSEQLPALVVNYYSGEKTLDNYSDLTSKLLKSIAYPTDKVTKKTFSNEITTLDNTASAIDVGKGALTYAYVSFTGKDPEKDPTLKISTKFDYTDLLVLSIIGTFYDVEGGSIIVSPEDILKNLTGNKNAQVKEEGQQKNNIIRSMEKMTTAYIWLDITDEVRKKRLTRDKYVWKKRIIETETIYITKNNTTDIRWVIKERPILHCLAMERNQIQRIPLCFLNTPVNKNKTTTEIQGFLLDRIFMYSSNPKLRPWITFESIYEAADISHLSGASLRNKKSDVKSFSIKMLDFWKENGLIDGYSLYPEDPKIKRKKGLKIHVKTK